MVSSVCISMQMIFHNLLQAETIASALGFQTYGKTGVQYGRNAQLMDIFVVRLFAPLPH